MNEETINVAEAKKRFSELLGRVAYGNTRILLTKRGKPMARLIPVGGNERHVGDTRGWLDDDDPFFDDMKRIVERRSKHIPRILE
ncbi:MAG: type II toxin-antitoxin system Phd/YefM family antitoxin [Desulfobacterales bacterium]